jgi:hypothetical protein
MNKVPEGASTSVTKKRPNSEAVAGTSPDITPTEAGDLSMTKAGDGLDGGHRPKGGNVAKKSKISETTSPVLDVKNLNHQSNPTKREYLVDKVNVTLKTYMEFKQKVKSCYSSQLVLRKLGSSYNNSKMYLYVHLKYIIKYPILPD